MRTHTSNQVHHVVLGDRGEAVFPELRQNVEAKHRLVALVRPGSEAYLLRVQPGGCDLGEGELRRSDTFAACQLRDDIASSCALLAWYPGSLGTKGAEAASAVARKSRSTRRLSAARKRSGSVV